MRKTASTRRMGNGQSRRAVVGEETPMLFFRFACVPCYNRANSKSQIPNYKQAPNSKHQTRRADSCGTVWCLEVGICLCFVICDLRFASIIAALLRYRLHGSEGLLHGVENPRPRL